MASEVRIAREIGPVSEVNNGYQKEFNIIQCDSGAYLFDLRNWSIDHQNCDDGFSFTEDEAKVLLAYLKEVIKDGEGIDIGTVGLPAKPAAAPNPQPEMHDNKVLDLLKKEGLEYIDKRVNGGALWVVGGHELDKTMEEIDSKGYKFTFTEKGGRATKYKPGWYYQEKKVIDPGQVIM